MKLRKVSTMLFKVVAGASSKVKAMYFLLGQMLFLGTSDTSQISHGTGRTGGSVSAVLSFVAGGDCIVVSVGLVGVILCGLQALQQKQRQAHTLKIRALKKRFMVKVCAKP